MLKYHTKYLFFYYRKYESCRKKSDYEMKTMLQGIPMMEVNELPGETFSLENVEIKHLISLYG